EVRRPLGKTCANAVETTVENSWPYVVVIRRTERVSGLHTVRAKATAPGAAAAKTHGLYLQTVGESNHALNRSRRLLDPLAHRRAADGARRGRSAGAPAPGDASAGRR